MPAFTCPHCGGPLLELGLGLGNSSYLGKKGARVRGGRGVW
jgi:hypothetical protein